MVKPHPAGCRKAKIKMSRNSDCWPGPGPSIRSFSSRTPALVLIPMAENAYHVNWLWKMVVHSSYKVFCLGFGFVLPARARVCIPFLADRFQQREQEQSLPGRRAGDSAIPLTHGDWHRGTGTAVLGLCRRFPVFLTRLCLRQTHLGALGPGGRPGCSESGWRCCFFPNGLQRCFRIIICSTKAVTHSLCKAIETPNESQGIGRAGGGGEGGGQESSPVRNE